jgi:hypothetical protein
VIWNDCLPVLQTSVVNTTVKFISFEQRSSVPLRNKAILTLQAYIYKVFVSFIFCRSFPSRWDYFSSVAESCRIVSFRNHVTGLINGCAGHILPADRRLPILYYLGRSESKNTRPLFHKRKTSALCGHRTMATLCVWMWKSSWFFIVHVRNLVSNNGSWIKMYSQCILTFRCPLVNCVFGLYVAFS